jgi:hypothetical protein
MKRPVFPVLKYCFIVLALTCAAACQNNKASLSPGTKQLITDSTGHLMTNISKDISAKGPIAWITYFEDSPGFFMASGGQLALKDYPTAVSFVKNSLVKSITGIKLNWQTVKVDVLSDTYAAIGTDFHEDITSNGQSMPFSGYFTALAHFDGKTWKLRNLHWSMREPYYSSNH